MYSGPDAKLRSTTVVSTSFMLCDGNKHPSSTLYDLDSSEPETSSEGRPTPGRNALRSGGRFARDPPPWLGAGVRLLERIASIVADVQFDVEVVLAKVRGTAVRAAVPRARPARMRIQLRSNRHGNENAPIPSRFAYDERY